MSEKFNRNAYSDDPVAGIADLVPQLNDRGEVIGYRTEIKKPSFPDGSDAYANNWDTILSFQNIRNHKDVNFKAFITSFNESFTPNFNPTEVFGRTDPIYQYKNTTRTITLAWKIPAASEGEAYENLGKVQELIAMLYPSYTNTPNALTLSKAPLVRLKVMNLIQSTVKLDMLNEAVGPAPQNPTGLFQDYISVSSPDYGLLGVITSCNVNHNLEGTDGVFQKQKNTVLPKMIDVNISFSPLHEKTLKDNEASFPYGVTLATDDKTNNFTNSPPGMTLQKLRDVKNTLEEKRREASSAQQNIDKRKAALRRAKRKAFMLRGGGDSDRAADSELLDKTLDFNDAYFDSIEAQQQLESYEDEFEELLG